MDKGKRITSVQEIPTYSKTASVSFQKDVAQERNNKCLQKHGLQGQGDKNWFFTVFQNKEQEASAETNRKQLQN